MKVNGSFGVNSSGNLQRSSAFLQKGKFERSGLQKYEQPTKVFCLIENLEEFFSEIKSSSNSNRFCCFEDKRIISIFLATSTSLHLGGAEISPRQAVCVANGLTSEPGGEDCRGVICVEFQHFLFIFCFLFDIRRMYVIFT